MANNAVKALGFHGHLSNTKLSKVVDGVTSVHSPNKNNPKVTISPSLFKALKTYAALDLMIINDSGIATDSSGRTLAELKNDDDTVDLAVLWPSGLVAGSLNTLSGSINQYTVAPGKRYGTVLMFALMPQLLADKEFKDTYERIREDLVRDESDIVDFEQYEKDVAILSANVYYRMINKLVDLKVPGTGNISRLSILSVETAYVPVDIHIGNIRIFGTSANNSTPVNTYDKKSFLEDYILSPKRQFTTEEQACIPKIGDDYIIQKEAVKIATRAKASTYFKEPMRNFYLYGPAGSGKTQLASSVAAALGLPKMVFTCGPDTDAISILGGFIPNANKGTRDISITIEDITYDLEYAYKQLTGEDTLPLGFTKEECIELYISKMQESKEPDFYFQESPIIKAMREGYLVEIQEITVCKPTALECLNSLLENGGEITLPTGERIVRHADTVVIATANTMYAGNREVNQAIKSRMAVSYKLDLPGKDIIVERIMAKSELKDKTLVTQMVELGMAIEEHCATMDMPGMCGMREYINWANDTVISGNASESCIDTVISKIGSDDEFQAELIETYLMNSALAM